MKNIKLSDFEVKVLDGSEKEESLKSIRELVFGRAEKLKGKSLIAPNGQHVDAFDFFNMAQYFEMQIHHFGIERQMPMANDYAQMMGQIIQEDPFFEYFFLIGKNYIHGLRDTEDSLRYTSPNKGIRKIILDTHVRARDNFSNARKLFIETKLPENMRFYETTMEIEKAVSYKREFFFRGLSESDINSVFKNNDLLDDLVIPSQAAIKIYHRLLEKGIFLHKEQAARAIYNLANVMKFIPDKYKKALEYCNCAKEILGGLPEIEETTRYYEDALKE
ncbi:hypothetical protein A3K73_00325 [Candidatus Pacearchaeota archaeon RBG_13_36_9]|nr:MAG: hypothetical protein A3K73_00325 [Candidatus Pacearchaeota archaeon RBG_13_36_9]HJX50303.1 hypothetical protein [Candidatus Nanoarchaeia archaeon]